MFFPNDDESGLVKKDFHFFWSDSMITQLDYSITLEVFKIILATNTTDNNNNSIINNNNDNTNTNSNNNRGNNNE